MRKAVAVPYVIALILGVAVIALIGIWFVMAGGKFSKSSAELECKKAIAIACVKSIGVPGDVTPDTTDQTKCNDVGVPVPRTTADCKTQGYIS